MRPVSVVIPVRDGGPLLRRVLDAVRAQGELELVVVDSGSTDGSLELAALAWPTWWWRSRRPSSGTAARATWPRSAPRAS